MSSTLTIAWITLPFLSGFLIYLLPKIDRYLALGVALAGIVYALPLVTQHGVIGGEPSLTLELLDRFGVTLVIDQLSGYFILTNALVTTAVILYCWHSNKTAFFYTQTTILYGSVNATFVCSDFMSLYVALEVISIAAFLLIAYSRSDRSIWVGLRYLFVSNVAMLFYLVGAVLVYKANHSFAFAGLGNAPPEAVALIFLGILTKGGIFVSGLWLPLTHSESETPVSALLSGIVVKTGVFSILRCVLMFDSTNIIIRIFGVAAALLGVTYAVFEKDTKRMLALSTISQLGWILAAPEVGGIYALAHGLVKAVLFLSVGALPSRNIKELQQQPIATSLWLVLVIACLSISGFPFLVGFGAKILTLKNLLPWQWIAMNVAVVGTAIAYARFIFLLHNPQTGKAMIKPGFWLAAALLIGALIATNGVYLEAYTLANMTKAIGFIGVGWVIYRTLVQRVSWKLPRVLEQLEHLVGVMSVMLVLLFWMVVA